MLGFSALIVLDDYKKLPPLFSRLAEQAMVALYVIDKSMLASVSDLARQNSAEIKKTIEKDPRHLIYKVDGDSAESDGKVIELLSIGVDCPNVLSEAVGIDS